jgi:hypothetical protein
MDPMTETSELQADANRRVVMESIESYRLSSGKPTNTIVDPLAELTPATLALVAASINAGDEYHVISLLANCNRTASNDLVAEFLKLLPQLTEDQQWIARTYFTTLRRWRAGNPRCLDLMIYFGMNYLEATGSQTLPYTSKEDQQLFEDLSDKPRLVDAILARTTRTDEITPELITELSRISPALIDGAL